MQILGKGSFHEQYFRQNIPGCLEVIVCVFYAESVKHGMKANENNE